MENDCPICSIIKALLPPFTKVVYSDNEGSKIMYRLDLPDWNHNERYQALGIYQDFIMLDFCPGCAKPLDDDDEDAEIDVDYMEDDEEDTSEDLETDTLESAAHHPV